MKLLFISPSYSAYERVPSLPLGLLSISSYLEKLGHEVRIVDRTIKREPLKPILSAFRPDIVGFSVISPWGGIDAKKLTAEIRKAGIPVVWGGHIVTMSPEVCLDDGQPDMLMMGEGEKTWAELADALANGTALVNVDGLALKKNGVMIYTRQRDFIDLTALPPIDWQLIDPPAYFQEFFNCKKMLYLYFTKGCPGQCTFCFNKCFHRSTNRSRTALQMADEIQYLVDNYGMDGVYFSDEMFCPNKKIMYEFLSLIHERNISFAWGIQTRIGVLKRDDLQAMYDAGCRWALFGVEGATEERIKLIKKGTDLSKAAADFKNCRDIGITTQSSFIIGYEDEDENELRETIRFGRSLNANICPYNCLTLFPGTEMFFKAIADGRIRPYSSLREMAKRESVDRVTVNMSKVPTRDLMVIHNYSEWKAFASKDTVNGEKFGVLKKAASDAAKNIFTHGPVGFFVSTYTHARRFLRIWWYAKAYPGIVKKYGLD